MASVNTAIEEKLITARIGLLLKQGWFGNMATRMKLIDVTDDGWLPTAATDGRNFYYNREFVDKLSIKEIEFLFGHEVLHAVFEHCYRRDSRDARLWNIACDYSVNDILIQENVGERVKTVPIVYDPKYRGRFAEDIYDELYESAEKIDVTIFDYHLDPEGDDPESDGAGGGSGNEGEDGDKKGRAPSLSKEEQEQIRNEIKEAMISAAKAAGNAPAAIKRMIKELTEPKLNWKEMLRQQIQSVIRDDYTFQRPNRKTFGSGICLPGMKNQETIDICIAVDASGSIDETMIRDFFSEIKSILDQYQDYNIKVLTFDTQVYNVQDFTSYDGDELINYDVTGGGGTEFMCVWNYFKEEDYVPKKLIMFTDGYPWGSWGDENYCDTIFIIHGPERIIPPFGLYAHIGNNS